MMGYPAVAVSFDKVEVDKKNKSLLTSQEAFKRL